MAGGDDQAAKVAGDVQRKVELVKSVVHHNVQQVAAPAADNPGVGVAVVAGDYDVHDQAAAFRSHGTRARQRLCAVNRRVAALAAGAVVAVALIIFLAACFAGGRSCIAKHAGGGGGGGREPHYINAITYMGVPQGDSTLSPGDPNPTAAEAAPPASSASDGGAIPAAAAPGPAGAREPHFVNNITYVGVPQGDSTLSPGEPIDVAATGAAAGAGSEPAAAEPAGAGAAQPKEPHFVNNITYVGVPEGDSALSPGDLPAVGG